jgi:hypothetical protein
MPAVVARALLSAVTALGVAALGGTACNPRDDAAEGEGEGDDDPCRTINGTLVIDDDDDVASFADVCSAVAVRIGGSVRTVTLPRLEHLDGPLSVLGNAALESVSLPALASLAGGVMINGSPVLANVELPALRTANGFFCRADALPSLRLPLLESTGSGTFIYGSEMALLELPSLVSVGGPLAIDDTALPTLSLPALTTVDSGLAIRGHDELTTLSVPLLTSAREVTISENPVLTSCTGALIENVGDCVQ